jgi:hypothetical protein
VKFNFLRLQFCESLIKLSSIIRFSESERKINFRSKFSFIFHVILKIIFSHFSEWKRAKISMKVMNFNYNSTNEWVWVCAKWTQWTLKASLIIKHKARRGRYAGRRKSHVDDRKAILYLTFCHSYTYERAQQHHQPKKISEKIATIHCCVIISPTITTKINIYGDALESVQKYVSDSPHHTT